MTILLGSPRIEALSREESVRGTLVRIVLQQAETADDEELLLLEDALKLLLTRFEAVGEATQ